MYADLVARLRARSALLQHEARLEGDEPFTSELLDAAADEIVRLPRAANGYQEAAQKVCDIASSYASTLGSGEEIARFYEELLGRLK